MYNMWSENKIIDKAIYVLIFLLSLNIFHYGQIIVPIICLILFVDNKYKFKINNWFIFVILCLFAISFFAFSYQQSIFCVAGFFLPMAYYIGSNAKFKSYENIKKVLYAIILGMVVHALLNFALDYKVYGISLFRKLNHYDFWIKDVISSTGAASNCLLIFSIIYYLITYEKNKTYKTIGLICFVIAAIYNIAIGRRTPVFILIICFIVSVVVDYFIFRSNVQSYKPILYALGLVCLIVVLIIGVFKYNLFNLRYILSRITIFEKFIIDGFSTDRLDIFLQGIKHAPDYLWGGQNISQSLGIQVHDMWTDIYDFAGIVPFICIVVYTINYAIRVIKRLFSKTMPNEYKILEIEKQTVIAGLLLTEPAFTGLSIFVICAVLLEACYE